MGTEVEHHALVAATEDHGVGQRGQARADLDGTATGVVEHAIFKSPATEAPGPAGDGAVDECGPEEGEDHGREKSTAFGDGSHNDGGGDGAELHLPGISSVIFGLLEKMG